MQIYGIKQPGIPKYQEGTDKNGIQLSYSGPQYYQIVQKMKEENPEAYNRLQEEVAQSETSEISKPWIDADGNVRRSTNVGAGFVSGTDPVGALYVEGVAATPIFNLAGRAVQYGLAKANNWARAKILSTILDNSPKNVNEATQAFRNSEWSNFLATRNGDKYYRMSRSSKLSSANIKGEKLFISHTTPWEEFTGLGTSEPIGMTTLYEFPTETFGIRSASSYKGAIGNADITQMGRDHLLFGKTSSGYRGRVQLLSEENAKKLGMDPYTIGVSSRPLNQKGFYDKNPIYEDIYQGNQTVVTSDELRNALLNSTYNQFEYSPEGVIKKLHIPYKRTNVANKTSRTQSEYPFTFQVLQDAKDIEALKAFAQKYGYKLPKGIERYTGEMLDKEFKRILTQHNTFGRGVTANNVQDAEKFLTTAHSGTAGAMDGMPVGKTGIYTMNGISPYGNYQGVVQRQLDFSGPRNSWIGKNDAAYLTRDEASQPLYSIQSQYMLDHPNTGDYNYYDEMFDYIKTNHPEVFNSSGQIYTPNNTNVIKQVGDSGIVIHGGNPGEKVLDAVNIFTPYNIGGKSSTRGFSHKAYKIGGKLK